jgi:hypothetical protein
VAIGFYPLEYRPNPVQGNASRCQEGERMMRSVLRREPTVFLLFSSGSEGVR